METKTVKLKPETAAKISQIDKSIVFWSVESTKAMMHRREIETQISSLYDFKRAAILEDMKDQEIDTTDCEITTIGLDTVSIRSTASNPETPPMSEPVVMSKE